MKVLATLVHSAKRPMGNDGKEIATLLFVSGDDSFSVTMFDNDIKQGKFDLYTKVMQKEVMVDIRVDLYKGAVQFRLGYDDPRVIAPKAAVAA